MANAIAPPPAGTSSASTQGVDQQRLMRELYSAWLGNNTFLPAGTRLRQPDALGLDPFMDYESPDAPQFLLPLSSVAPHGNDAGRRSLLGNGQDMSRMLALPKYQQGLPPNGFLTERVPPALNDIVQQKCNLAHGNDAVRRNLLGNGQDMSRMLALPKYQQGGLLPNGFLTERVPPALNDLVQQKCNLAHGNDVGPRRNILEKGQDMSRMLAVPLKYQQGLLPPNGFLTERVAPALNDLVQEKCNLAHGNDAGPRRNILENGQDMSRTMLAVPKYQQGLPPNGLSSTPAPLNDPEQQKLNLVQQQQQYVLKNWQEKLSDSYRDIPETSLPRKDMFPYPKRKGDLIAAKKKKNKHEKKRRRRSKNESSSEAEHDSSSSDEEEGAKIHSTPESAGTVVSFDDGRKWRVERVGNVSILSPYI
jgi:hypothetical protein